MQKNSNKLQNDTSPVGAYCIRPHFEGNTGITLIALVITIIVLIILAAVSLNVLLGENGIIGRAQQASRETKLAAFKEKLEMEIAAIVTDLLADGKEPNLENVEEKLDELGYHVTPEEDGTLTVETDDGGRAKVHPDLTVEVEGAPNQSGGGGATETGDTTVPTGEASYSPETATGGTVRVTITTNKEIVTPNGWTKQDITHYYKDYTTNTTETITITDLVSNTGSVQINVTNILIGAIVEEPVVTGGLTPVKWNGTDWVTTTTSDVEWSCYIAQPTGTPSGGTSRWANAKTANGSFLVWIPRYEYKITSGEHGAGLAAGEAGTIDVNFISKSTTTPTSGYTIHSAFTNSGNGGLGELAGIWVGKFENSSNNGSVGTSGDYIKIVPNATSWVMQTISQMYYKCQNFASENSITGWDSHMIKNTEWGAVAYLAHSKYGRNGTEITENNETTKTGKGAGFEYTEPQGQLASTTGNIYGVYDMIGGASEYVMGVFNKVAGASEFSSSLTEIPTKYCDNYTEYSAIYKGDAMYETSSELASTAAWFGDAALLNNLSTNTWIFRGGITGHPYGVGLFNFNTNNGGWESNLNSTRVILSK